MGTHPFTPFRAGSGVSREGKAAPSERRRGRYSPPASRERVTSGASERRDKGVLPKSQETPQELTRLAEDLLPRSPHHRPERTWLKAIDPDVVVHICTERIRAENIGRIIRRYDFVIEVFERLTPGVSKVMSFLWLDSRPLPNLRQPRIQSSPIGHPATPWTLFHGE